MFRLRSLALGIHSSRRFFDPGLGNSLAKRCSCSIGSLTLRKHWHDDNWNLSVDKRQLKARSAAVKVITSLRCFSSPSAAERPPVLPSISRAQAFVQACPPKLQPYLKLSRIDRPIGTWLLFWPCTWGLTIGAGGLPSLELLTLFGAGAFIMRGAGCTINDMWDRTIDAQVKRTKDRPLASRELRMRHAAVWLGAQLSAALWILFQLNTPCFVLGVTSLGLVVLYPLAKRVTNWPQLVLGFTFNMGVPMGFTAATVASANYLDFPSLNATCGLLYTSGILWTLIYDTIYAHQDREDDAYLGLGSTARRLGENTKYWLQGFSITMLGCLGTVGYINELSWPYYAGIAITASHLAWQISTLDIHNQKNCWDRFVSNRHIGWIIFLSILSSYVWTSYGKKYEQTVTDTPISQIENALRQESSENERQG